MAGLNTTIEDHGVAEALQTLLRQVGTIEPVLREIGEHEVPATQDRIVAQKSPDGTDWPALSPAYARWKRSYFEGRIKKRGAKAAAGGYKGNKMLILEGALVRGIHYQVSADDVRWGTSEVYGAALHWGRPEINLPARHWLGLPKEDAAWILDLVARHIEAR